MRWRLTASPSRRSGSSCPPEPGPTCGLRHPRWQSASSEPRPACPQPRARPLRDSQGLGGGPGRPTGPGRVPRVPPAPARSAKPLPAPLPLLGGQEGAGRARPSPASLPTADGRPCDALCPGLVCREQLTVTVPGSEGDPCPHDGRVSPFLRTPLPPREPILRTAACWPEAAGGALPAAGCSSPPPGVPSSLPRPPQGPGQAQDAGRGTGPREAPSPEVGTDKERDEARWRCVCCHQRNPRECREEMSPGWSPGPAAQPPAGPRSAVAPKAPKAPRACPPSWRMELN